MPSNNVFQYSKIRTRKRSAKKSIKTGKKMESSSFWNPESTVLESGIRYPESGIHSMESRIQDCPGFPCMGRGTISQFFLGKNSPRKYIYMQVTCYRPSSTRHPLQNSVLKNHGFSIKEGIFITVFREASQANTSINCN